MSVTEVLAEYKADSDAVHSFCDELYNELFGDNFKAVRELYSRMKSTARPITDEELEYILSTFPLELFTVAENLNKLRLDYEVVKLKNKEKAESLRKQFVKEAEASFQFTKSQIAEYVAHRMTESMIEYEVVLTAYESVITRVENEQSFSRELIMGAKKIWDSRRSSEKANPVNSSDVELPEYSRKQYIK